VAIGFVPQPFPGELEAFRPDPRGSFPTFSGGSPAEPPPEASSDADTEVQQAYAEGLAAGRAELLTAEAAALRRATGVLGDAVVELGQWRRGEQRRVRHAALEVARLVAARVLQCELSHDLDLLAPRVEEALGLLEGAEPVSVTLSPVDRDVVAECGAPGLERLCTEWGARLDADPALAPGDVRVRGGETRVDARLASVLDRIGEALAELLGAEEEPSL